MAATTLATVLGGVTVKLGDNIWNFGIDFLLFLLIAAIVGIVAELIVGWSMPLGIIGSIIVGVVGAWLMTRVFIISGIGDINLFGVPIIRALIGAIILIAIWHLITGGVRRSRRRI